jgi:hypothetical protein
MRAQMDVDVVDAETVGGVEFGLHTVDRFLAQTAFGRRQVHQIRGVDDPRADRVLGGLCSEPLCLCRPDRGLLPDLWRGGENLPAGSAKGVLPVDGVADVVVRRRLFVRGDTRTGDRDVCTDLHR